MYKPCGIRYKPHTQLRVSRPLTVSADFAGAPSHFKAHSGSRELLSPAVWPAERHEQPEGEKTLREPRKLLGSGRAELTKFFPMHMPNTYNNKKKHFLGTTEAWESQTKSALDLLYWVAQEYQRAWYANWRFKYYKIPETEIKTDFYFPRRDVLVQCS